MAKYQQFVFESYRFDPATGILELRYAYDNTLHFTETYKFVFAFTQYDPVALDRALQALFFLAGVSYYKMYLAPGMVINAGTLDETQAAFFSKTYQRGLGEFWYVNSLDPRTPVIFPVTAEPLPPLPDGPAGRGILVSIGGGKDSLVTIEALREKVPVTTWSLNHRPQLTPLVERIGLPHAWVERAWDPQIMELNKQDALNGHVPISGIFACVGTIVAILTGKRDIVVSNEQSANDPTLTYEGVTINHQYSKSQEFEKDYQAYLAHTQGDRLRYYSFLRPLSEVRIAEFFSKGAFQKYRDVFSSCNRAFLHGSHRMSWCGECPKCAFVYMALAPFVPSEQLDQLWGGKNLLLEPALEPTYRKLLGIEGDKPLECIGDTKESRAAMRLAAKQYPELAEKYHFGLPDDYNYAAEAGHEMPPDIYALYQATKRA